MKRILCFLLSLFLLLSSAAWAEDAETAETEAFDELEDIENIEDDSDLDGLDEAEDDEIYWVDYDYKELYVGNATPLQGKFFTGLWGGSTSDLDVQELLHAYNLVKWDSDLVNIRLNHRVVSGAVILDDAAGNRTYLLALYDDLRYSDGTPITAYDYAFSLLLMVDPVIAELGGQPMDASWLMGIDEYLSGESKTLAGLRVIDEKQLRITVKAESLPYFYEMARLNLKPYPISEIAPDTEVKDEGEGVFFSQPLDAKVLQKTILDPDTGYMTHPRVVSGPYTLSEFDPETATAHFRINEEYAGNENNQTPQLWDLYYGPASNENMIQELGDGMFGLLNKVTFSRSLIDGIRLAQTQGHQYTMSNYPRTGLTLIWFTEDSPRTQSLAVRRAIAQCLDRESFVRSYVGPFGLVIDGLYGLGQWMYGIASGTSRYPIMLPENDPQYEETLSQWEEISLDGLTRYSLDVEAAIRLLEEDGWTLGPDGAPYDPAAGTARYKEIDGELVGLTLTISMPPSQDAIQAMEQYFLPHLAEAGMPATLQPMDLRDLQQVYEGNQEDSVDLLYLGENFSLIFDPTIFRPATENVEDAEEDSLPAVRAEIYALGQDMVHTNSRDLLSFMQKWVVMQERISQKLPLIPIYSNVYFDFYTRELYDYRIEDAVTWAEAIVPAYMSDPETYDASAEAAIGTKLEEMEQLFLEENTGSSGHAPKLFQNENRRFILQR